MEQSPDAANLLRYVTLLEAHFQHFAFEQKTLRGVLFFYQYNAVYVIEKLYELCLDVLPDSPSDDDDDVNNFWIAVRLVLIIGDFCYVHSS